MAIAVRRKGKQVRKTTRRTPKSAVTAGVRLVYPSDSPAAIERGRRLAERIRKELAGSDSESLNDAMSNLRGREWS